MWDRKFKKQLKENVLKAGIVTVCIYGLGTLTLRQKEMIQIAQHNWVRRICKAAQEDRWKMKELIEEIGKKKTPKNEISRMRWAGHVQKRDENKLTKRAWKAEEGCRKRRGKPNLRWKDCDKRDVERAGT